MLNRRRANAKPTTAVHSYSLSDAVRNLDLDAGVTTADRCGTAVEIHLPLLRPGEVDPDIAGDMLLEYRLV
jgi:hypothetical protein